jgi:hypothetical protein
MSLPRGLAGQSLTSGAVGGVVRDTSGAPLGEVLLTLEQRGTGLARVANTPHSGRFNFAMVPPGDYDLLVERLGFLPRRLRGLVVAAGRTLRVDLTVNRTAGLVRNVDTASFHAGALTGGPAGVGQWFGAVALEDLPTRGRDLSELARLAPNTTVDIDGLAVEGLPGALTNLVVDGVPFVPARHPRLDPGGTDAAAFPLPAFARAELVTTGADVEWTGSSGAFLHGFSRSGGRTLQLHGYGDYSGNALSNSKYFDTGAASFTSARGGLMVAGPLVSDTASYALGFEYRKVAAPRAPAWVADSLTASFDSVARDSFNVDLGPYLRPAVSTSTEFSGFAHLDWQIAAAHALSLRANFASIDATNPDLGAGAPAGSGTTVKGTDVSGALSLSSVFSSGISQELRISLNGSSRDYTADSLPATTLVDGGWSFGADPGLTGKFRRTDFLASEAVYIALGPHTIKLGGGAAVTSHDITYADGRDGAYVYAGVNEFKARQGRFTQTVGRLPVAAFSTSRLSAFLQDNWTATPGLDAQLGVRMDRFGFPLGDLRLNDSLRAATGLKNNAVQSGRMRIDPRFGFRWDVGQQHAWLLQGAFGVYRGATDPGVWSEAITHSGSQAARVGDGALGDWPKSPDSTLAPVQGASLTVLAPGYEPPRSRRGTLGLSRALGSIGALHLSGTYRFTDLLLRRHDLNRVLGTTGSDQYGRPLYGTLTQRGSIVDAVPGSNARFTSFDRIWGLDADGSSKYVGFTVLLERQLPSGVGFLAGYTYSKTTDDVMSGRGTGADAQLWPFPDSVNGTDWTEGRSDYDIPHRLVGAISLPIPAGRVRPMLSAVFQYRSGNPFTPGFRDGVDVNGDGSGRNDPAFIDPGVAGASAVIDANSCLGSQTGQFAQRNSCRDPAVKSLDLRLAVGLPPANGVQLSLLIDAYNVLESNQGSFDHAVYLVDRTQTLTTNSVTGVTTIPLVANPHFGQLLSSRSPGRWWRLGLEVSF